MTYCRFEVADSLFVHFRGSGLEICSGVWIMNYVCFIRVEDLIGLRVFYVIRMLYWYCIWWYSWKNEFCFFDCNKCYEKVSKVFVCIFLKGFGFRLNYCTFSHWDKVFVKNSDNEINIYFWVFICRITNCINITFTC